MKIGILTYHRSHNYGALLQAIALREILQVHGHTAFFIDYWPSYHQHMYALFSMSTMRQQPTLRKKISYLKTCIVNLPYRKQKADKFKQFIHRHIEPNIASPYESFDLIIHGSDQIWRKQPELNQYNPIYFGVHAIPATRKITYAASMGILPTTQQDHQILRDYISHLDRVSVREEELKKLVIQLGFHQARLDIDPTLLLTPNQWETLFFPSLQPSKPYILFYDLCPNSFRVSEIVAFARHHHWNLKTLYGTAEGKETDDRITTADPIDFLRLIHGASMVFTSSFHGLVFAILFQKPFYAAFAQRAGRAESILQQIHLLHLLLSPMTSIPLTVPAISYDKVGACLQSLRKKSLAYLKAQLTSE